MPEQEVRPSEVNVDGFEQRVGHAAQLVDDGVCSIEDCEAHETTDRTDEEFRAAVRERLEDDEQAVSVRDGEDEDGIEHTTRDPERIDWDAVWEQADISPGKPLYRPQIRALLAISTQTPVNESGAEDIIKDGIRTGVLRDCGSQVAPIRGGES